MPACSGTARRHPTATNFIRHRWAARGGGEWPTESSDPTQHAKGRTGDRPGPRKGATTRRNVTQGGSGPPLGPLRRTVERSGRPGKGRNLCQDRGGQNQARRRGHGAAEISRNTTQAHMPPASTITERTPPPATIKERAMHTRDPWSGGAQGVDGRYNARRSGAPGPHAHGNVGR